MYIQEWSTCTNILQNPTWTFTKLTLFFDSAQLLYLTRWPTSIFSIYFPVMWPTENLTQRPAFTYFTCCMNFAMANVIFATAACFFSTFAFYLLLIFCSGQPLWCGEREFAAGPLSHRRHGKLNILYQRIIIFCVNFPSFFCWRRFLSVWFWKAKLCVL